MSALTVVSTTSGRFSSPPARRVSVSIRRLGREGQQVTALDVALAALAEEAVPPDVRRQKAARG